MLAFNSSFLDLFGTKWAYFEFGSHLLIPRNTYSYIDSLMLSRYLMEINTKDS